MVPNNSIEKVTGVEMIVEFVRDNFDLMFTGICSYRAPIGIMKEN